MAKYEGIGKLHLTQVCISILILIIYVIEAYASLERSIFLRESYCKRFVD